jgi:hypothetical protein
MPAGPRPGSSTQRSRAEIEAEIQRLERKKREEQGSASSGGTAPPIQGTAVKGASLAQKLAWLQKGADSHTTYIVEADADESIAPYTFEFPGGINITVVLRGVGGNRTIRLSSHGTMFTVRKEVTLILDNNITLKGHEGNDRRMVSVEGGKFKMNAGTSIIDNTGGGVYVSGTFEMAGGTVSGNGHKDLDGGGVNMGNGTFTMAGGIISNNTASLGGGVDLNGSYGVGVMFTMTGGTISGNTAAEGGGVNLLRNICGGTFIMRGGIISGNTARVSSGGVRTPPCSNFSKTGGTITGYKSDPTNGNVVKDEDGNVLARKGHAVWFDENKRKETTAGPGANFKDGAGPWDQ